MDVVQVAMADEAAPKAPSRNSSLGSVFRILGCLGLLLILLVLFTPLHYPAGQLWYEWRNEGEFERRRDTYQAIVQAVSGLSIAPERTVFLLISADKDPSTLRMIDEQKEPALFLRANETNLIQAKRWRDGRLTVRICTYSMGHAGVYGLYYSEGTPEAGEVENSFGMGARTAPVAPHWWRVADDSQ